MSSVGFFVATTLSFDWLIRFYSAACDIVDSWQVARRQMVIARTGLRKFMVSHLCVVCWKEDVDWMPGVRCPAAA